ncbi:MAG: ABC transporter permease [Ruminococcus sp.]|nr:ABC transporter permease [Ruminococcus sp.]
MKFFNLLRKELKELINAQMILSLVMIVVIFMVFGNVMSSTISEAVKSESSVTLSDCDDTEFTRELLKKLEENDVTINKIDTSAEGDDYAAILANNKLKSIVIIPKGFTEALDNGEHPELITATEMKSAALIESISSTAGSGIDQIKSIISDEVAARTGVTEEELDYIDNPITVTDNTVISGKSAKISPESIIGRVMMLNEFLPIIIFVLIVMTSQSLMGAISNEKIDKTLETLLSAPVSRISILTAKMLAATIAALLNVVVCMVAFSGFMAKAAIDISKNAPDALTNAAVNAQNMVPDSVSGNLSGVLSAQGAMNQLGLTLTATDYLLVGIEMFVTIMICLCISLILGALVTDAKQSQTILLPLMMAVMVPYFISIFADVNSLPTVVRYLVYAIPFTHTFSAIPNLMFGHTGLFIGGLIYQVIFLAACMYFALKIFNSDKILTMSLNFGKKRKKKGAPEEE